MCVDKEALASHPTVAVEQCSTSSAIKAPGSSKGEVLADSAQSSMSRQMIEQQLLALDQQMQYLSNEYVAKKATIRKYRTMLRAEKAKCVKLKSVLYQCVKNNKFQKVQNVCSGSKGTFN